MIKINGKMMYRDGLKKPPPHKKLISKAKSDIEINTHSLLNAFIFLKGKKMAINRKMKLEKIKPIGKNIPFE